MAQTLLVPAFGDAVHETQQTFRAALKALSEPGLIQSLQDAPALDTLAPATYALCLSLLDNDTPVWLAPPFDTPVVRANLAFHCACPFVNAREAAQFALLTEAELHDLAAFDCGSDRDPDQSCSLLVQLPSLDQGAATTWHGPGIEQERMVRLPIGAGYWQQRQARHAFPRGLDLFFTHGQSLMGLPRSTHVRPILEGVPECM
jgi:alpha-D-ribose 1-methylphosphonate 5-triphosphate synthase subunit PhnH